MTCTEYQIDIDVYSYAVLYILPTCAHAWWALMHLLLCVWLPEDTPRVAISHTWLRVKGHIGQGQIRIPKKGRWAHNNINLLPRHNSF